jgi:uncharacterized protein
MHIKVSDILAQDIGYRADFEVEGERPQLSDLALAGDLEGRVTITRIKEGLLVTGQLETKLTLECHRCLNAFDAEIKIKPQGIFTDNPGEDEWPIVNLTTIDLAPMIRQELIVATPVKQLCEPDCKGLCIVCGERQVKERHSHSTQAVPSRIKFKKGKD